MSEITNPLDILKRLDVKQNVTIRVIDEPTGKVVQEHVGHNAATNSLLTGIAHYLMGDGVLNQGQDTLSMWVPQYISLGTMGLTSQESEIIVEGDQEYIVPKALGYTPVAPETATPEEKELNARLRFSEYINQAPGFGADGYDENSNNDREWFGLGYPYSLKPAALMQDFYTWDGTEQTLTLSDTPIDIVSVILYPDGIIDEDMHNTQIRRSVLSSEQYSVSGKYIHLNQYIEPIPENSRLAIIFTYDDSKIVKNNGVDIRVPGDAANCELIKAKINSLGNIEPETLRSKISYRNLVSELQSEIPNTLDVVFSAMVSTGALKDYRSDRDYIYITEAGLWSKASYNDSGDNGMLAGYRIMPTDDEVLDIAMQQEFDGDGVTTSFTFEEIATEIVSVTIDGGTIPQYSLDIQNNQIVFVSAPVAGSKITVIYKTDNITNSWKDMSILENRQKVQKSILRIGINQVAQVVWKIQLGGLEQLNGLRYLYPSQYPEEVWELIP